MVIAEAVILSRCSKPEKTGPTKEELAEQARIKREKEEAEKQARIKNKMRTGFNNTKKAGKGESGPPNGNSNTTWC